MLKRLEEWMQKKGYGSIGDFRGKLSHRRAKDPWAYLRSQYVRIVMSRPAGM